MIFKLIIKDFDTEEEVEVISPTIPCFRQSVNYFNKDGESTSQVVRFVDYVFDKDGNFKHVLLWVQDEVLDDLE